MSNYSPHRHSTKRSLVLSSLLKNQRGSAAVDYAVILVFVVLAVIAVILVLEDKSMVIFEASGEVVGNFGKME